VATLHVADGTCHVVDPVPHLGDAVHDPLLLPRVRLCGIALFGGGDILLQLFEVLLLQAVDRTVEAVQQAVDHAAHRDSS
jgi:hypothetical protein